MPELHSTLVSLAAFAGLPVIATQGEGVVVSDRDGLGLATVLVRKGQHEALAQCIREKFGLELPRGPRRSASGDVAFIGTAPGAWLATHEQVGNAFVQTLADATAGLASVSDQSDGYAVLRLSGPRVRDALCKLVPIDLHPNAFAVGAVAATVASYIGTTIWRLDDLAGSSVFEIAVYRSMADSFWSALSASAAEFGFKVAGR
jgi:heterotetrameric sarcosine oxidase gamma subunit